MLPATLSDAERAVADAVGRHLRHGVLVRVAESEDDRIKIVVRSVSDTRRVLDELAAAIEEARAAFAYPPDWDIRLRSA